jgi:hypothetical protein
MSYNSASPFLGLPAEIREMMYRYALIWPDLKAIFAKAKAELDRTGCELSPQARPLKTPCLFLLNRQIYREARDMQYRESLVIESPPPRSMHNGKGLPITEFMNRATLQSLRFVVFDMDLDFGKHPSPQADCWLDLVKELFEIWEERNCIEKVEIRFTYNPPTKIRGWTFREAQHHRSTMDLLSRVRH